MPGSASTTQMTVSRLTSPSFPATVHDSGDWVNDRAGTEPKDLFDTPRVQQLQSPGWRVMRFVRPENGTVSVRVGVSCVSTDKACKTAEKEIPGPDYDFGGLRKLAEDAWLKKLSPVAVESGGVSEDLLRTFWSGIYRTMLDPQDLTGENPLWGSDEAYFDSFYWYVSSIVDNCVDDSAAQVSGIRSERSIHCSRSSTPMHSHGWFAVYSIQTSTRARCQTVA